MNAIISALHFEWSSIEECFDRTASELGLDGVELSLHESYERPHCTRPDLAAVSASRHKYGITPYAHIWDDLARLGPEAGAERLLHWLAVCGAAGIEGLVIHGGSCPDQREGIERIARILQQVTPRFESDGIVLNLENHYAWDYQDCHELFSEPWEFLELFRSVNSPALRFCFDTGHGNMTRNSSALLRELAPWLGYVHLAGNHGVHDDHCGYKEGTVDWDGIFTVLQEIGYDGTFCVEFPVREDTAPFERCMRDIRRLWGG